MIRFNFNKNLIGLVVKKQKNIEINNCYT